MRVLSLAVVCLLAVSAGCQTPFTAATPVEAQRHYAANVHDPYPDPDMGPEVLGGRPTEYDKPYSTPRRIQFGRWLRESRVNPMTWFAR